MGRTVWLFDLDNTLHNASHAAFGQLHESMGTYIQDTLEVDAAEADRLRSLYWRRYGATLLGLVRHHDIQAPHFLERTHALPGLEERLHGHPHDVAALRRLPGEKYILTNAPRAYADRVLKALGIAHCFDGVVPIERMRMFGHWRPKPDARMFRQLLARLRVRANQCVLVEDTLAHQRAAHAVGLRTVWMQRWLRAAEVGGHLRRRPRYVCARISSLQQLPKRLR
jgi:putative hydrolase of the HAD superfamily